jgi:hypothetical protein
LDSRWADWRAQQTVCWTVCDWVEKTTEVWAERSEKYWDVTTADSRGANQDSWRVETKVSHKAVQKAYEKGKPQAVLRAELWAASKVVLMAVRWVGS